jgi:hypothetical protein
MLECVIGPLHGGYFIGCYAGPTDLLGGGYVGYFKVFTSPVGSYFDDGVCLVKGSVEATASEEHALRLAQERSRHQVMSLRPADDLPFANRRPFCWEATHLGTR